METIAVGYVQLLSRLSELSPFRSTTRVVIVFRPSVAAGADIRSSLLWFPSSYVHVEIAQFISITSSTPSEAQTFLAQANNDVEAAIGLFFAASDDPMDDPVPSDDEHDEEEETMTGGAATAPAPASVRASGGGAGAGGNTLGGGKAEPLPEGWGRPSGGGTGARVGRVGQWGGSGAAPSSQGSGSGPRIATLGSIGGGGGASGPSPSRGGGGDDDDDDDDGEEWYAGGERRFVLFFPLSLSLSLSLSLLLSRSSPRSKEDARLIILSIMCD
jgi:hypothetical protein